MTQRRWQDRLGLKSGTTWYVRLGDASGFGSAITVGAFGEMNTHVVFGDVLAKGSDACGEQWRNVVVLHVEWKLLLRSVDWNPTCVFRQGRGASRFNGDGKPDLLSYSSVFSLQSVQYQRDDPSFGSPIASFSAQLRYPGMGLSTQICGGQSGAVATAEGRFQR